MRKMLVDTISIWFETFVDFVLFRRICWYIGVCVWHTLRETIILFVVLFRFRLHFRFRSLFHLLLFEMTSPIETYKTLILLGMPVTSIEYQTVVVHSWRVYECDFFLFSLTQDSRIVLATTLPFAVLPHFKMKKCFCITLHTLGNILWKFIDQVNESVGEWEWGIETEKEKRKKGMEKGVKGRENSEKEIKVETRSMCTLFCMVYAYFTKCRMIIICALLER